jgi:potassium efflux system protein
LSDQLALAYITANIRRLGDLLLRRKPNLRMHIPPFQLLQKHFSHVTQILILVGLTLGGDLAAQSDNRAAAPPPVYQLTPVAPTVDGDSGPERLPLFSNSQPPLKPFVLRTPDKEFRVAPVAKPSASGIQLVSHETDSVVQTSGQVLIDTAPAATILTAESSADPDAPPAPTAAVIETQIKKVEQSALADDVKAVATKHQQQSIEFLRLAEEASQKSVKLKTEIDVGSTTLEEIKKRLAEPPEKVEASFPPTAKVAELDVLRLADEDRLQEARKAVDSWEAKARLRAERKPQMAAIIEKTTKQLAETRTAVPAADSTEHVVAEARKTEHQSLVTLLERQLNLYQIERTRYDALNELFPLQRDLAIRSRAQLEKRSEFWKTVILEAGRRESVRQAAEARRALQDAHPALRDLAAQNAKLTEERSKLQAVLEQTSSSLNTIRKLAEETQADFTDVKEKESRVGLTTAIGILLRNHRSHLPDEASYRLERRDAETEMARLQIEQMPLDDERKTFCDPAEHAELLVAELDPTTETSNADIQSMAFALLTDRQKYLDDVLNDYDKCIKDLAELDIRCRALVDTTVEFRNYIDARVLWIRSAGVVSLDTPQQAKNGLLEIASAVDITAIGAAVSVELTRSPTRTLLVIVVVMLLLGMQSRFRHWITTLSKSGSSKSGPGLAATTAAFGLTLLIASVWPGIVWLLGSRLASLHGDEFAITCGVALKTAAVVFWSAEVFRQICRANGIAELHLKWPVETVRSLHARLVGLMVAGLPFVFAVRFVEHWDEGAWSDSLGRLTFISGMCFLTNGLRQIVRPRGPVFRNLLEEHATGWMFRTRHVWSIAIIGAPLVLAGLSIAGFHYTAEQLLIRVEATAWLFIGLMMAFGLLIRRMHTARRNLAINKARQRRAAANAALEVPKVSGKVMPEVETQQIDFLLLSSQVLKLTQIAACALFAAGAWMVWAEVLPALQVFDQVELWSTLTEVVEEVEVANGVTKTILVSRASPVSLGSLILACGLLGIFVVASRNIPGLLELSVLQHLPLDDGGRNAITTLCRYALFTTGVVLFANMIGIGWSSVQWLLAALTVGLGFGLQEIFANFVSGLIILFERPVRIGDIVTIDDVSGTVSRIQIRATTITDFDRKEYIVPNKEFVTGRVLNWTLSDKTNRIKIEVGVGYGNDTMLARALLVKVARENPVVMDEPEPLATFEGFGDSCLMLSLRCFIPGLDNRLQVITDLHEAVDREFKTQGLEIAFPQRDIHIRTMTAIPIAAPVVAPPTVAVEKRKAA